MKILVAEDDEDDFWLLQLAFQRSATPVSLRRVKDGLEAIDYLAQLDHDAPGPADFVPEIVLLDLNMPGANGFDVIHWLRQNPRFKRAIIVVLSSSAEPKDVNLAYQMGANSFFTKPTSLQDLMTRVSLMYQYWQGCCQMPRWPAALEQRPGPATLPRRLN